MCSVDNGEKLRAEHKRRRAAAQFTVGKHRANRSDHISPRLASPALLHNNNHLGVEFHQTAPAIRICQQSAVTLLGRLCRQKRRHTHKIIQWRFNSHKKLMHYAPKSHYLHLPAVPGSTRKTSRSPTGNHSTSRRKINMNAC